MTWNGAVRCFKLNYSKGSCKGTIFNTAFCTLFMLSVSSISIQFWNTRMMEALIWVTQIQVNRHTLYTVHIFLQVLFSPHLPNSFGSVLVKDISHTNLSQFCWLAVSFITVKPGMCLEDISSTSLKTHAHDYSLKTRQLIYKHWGYYTFLLVSLLKM